MSLIFEAPDGRRACQHWWGHGVGRAVPMGWWDSGPTDVDQQDGSGSGQRGRLDSTDISQPIGWALL